MASEFTAYDRTRPAWGRFHERDETVRLGTLASRMLRPKVDQRKSEILDAAVQVIIEVGFTEMTVADVAKVAGVSTALVHYHFSSKVELITAALGVACDDDKELRDSVADGPGSAVHRLDRVLCGSLPADSDRCLVVAVDRDMGRDPPSAGDPRGDGRSQRARDRRASTGCSPRARRPASSCAPTTSGAARATVGAARRTGDPADPVRRRPTTGRFIDEFRGGICHELGLTRADYDRLAAIAE